MTKLLVITANLMAKATYRSAVAAAGSVSFRGIYQPKTPKALLKVVSTQTEESVR